MNPVIKIETISPSVEKVKECTANGPRKCVIPKHRRPDDNDKLTRQKVIYGCLINKLKVYRSTRYNFIVICYDGFEKEVNLKPWKIDLEIQRRRKQLDIGCAD